MRVGAGAPAGGRERAVTLIIPPGLLSNVVAFFGGVWGKLALYAILIGALAFGFRLWLNKHDDRILQQGKDRAVETMKADYDSRLKVSLAEAKAISNTAATDRAAIDVRLDKLESSFDNIFATVRQIKVIAQERQVIYVKEAAAVPPNKLDDALRAVSNDPAISPAH